MTTHTLSPTPATERPRRRNTHGSWTAELLDPEFRSLAGELSRGITGLALSALFGLALGTRAGGSAFLANAAGVPIGIAIICAVSVPSVLVFLTLFRVPTSMPLALSVVSRAAARAGLVLAGLAPAVALFAVTSEGIGPARLIGAIALTCGGAVLIGQLALGLGRGLSSAPMSRRAIAPLTLAGFALMTAVFALRVWSGAIPFFGAN